MRSPEPDLPAPAIAAGSAPVHFVYFDDALAVRPDAESRLVAFAQTDSLRRLRQECRRVKNADVSAADEYKKVHESRAVRTWTGRDGATCGTFRFTADAGAAFLAALEERKEKHVKAAHREGRHEPFDAYAADALVELVTEDRGRAGGGRAGRTRPQAMVMSQPNPHRSTAAQRSALNTATARPKGAAHVTATSGRSTVP